MTRINVSRAVSPLLAFSRGEDAEAPVAFGAPVLGALSIDSGVDTAKLAAFVGGPALPLSIFGEEPDPYESGLGPPPSVTAPPLSSIAEQAGLNF